MEEKAFATIILTVLLFHSCFLLSATVSDRLLFKEESGGAADEMSNIEFTEMKDYPPPGANCKHDPENCPPPSSSTDNFLD
ncbi:hypothetical protein ACET3Z_023468 [Daucus carota]